MIASVRNAGNRDSAAPGDADCDNGGELHARPLEFQTGIAEGSPGHESLSFRHRRVRSDACIATDTGGCPHRFLLPSSGRIDRPGSVRFQHAGAMHAHRVGIERDLQPSFQIVSSQPFTDTWRRLELAFRCHRETVRGICHAPHHPDPARHRQPDFAWRGTGGGREAPVSLLHAGCKIARAEQLHFHQPGAVPGHGIGQAYDVHQKPVLRTAGPPLDVVSDSAASKVVKPASGHRLQASEILDAPRTTLGNPRSAATP
jgi:hypothetical protein